MPKRRADSAEPFVPVGADLPGLAEAAARCRGCPLYEHATQTVFGEGAPHAGIMLVGEQPGDAEDVAGHPFVGPAGKVLDRALQDAGLDRQALYVTNAVKHFKFEERGKRRIHKRPSTGEINACAPWLRAEIDRIQPRVIVAMGAVAAQSVFGTGFALMKQRGQLVPSPLAPVAFATRHPSSVLRMTDKEARDAAYAELVADLRLARPPRGAAKRPR